MNGSIYPHKTKQTTYVQRNLCFSKHYLLFYYKNYVKSLSLPESSNFLTIYYYIAVLRAFLGINFWTVDV